MRITNHIETSSRDEAINTRALGRNIDWRGPPNKTNNWYLAGHWTLQDDLTESNHYEPLRLQSHLLLTDSSISSQSNYALFASYSLFILLILIILVLVPRPHPVGHDLEFFLSSYENRRYSYEGWGDECCLCEMLSRFILSQYWPSI